MERLMGTVANKVNDVLLKLDEFESSGRKLSAKVRQISSANSKSWPYFPKSFYVTVFENFKTSLIFWRENCYFLYYLKRGVLNCYFGSISNTVNFVFFSVFYWFWRENCYFLGNFNTVFFFIFIGDAEKKQQMQELVNEGLKEMDKN